MIALRPLLALPMISLVLTPASVRADKVDQHLAEAKKSGRPMFVMFGRESCGLCQALKGKLQSDSSLKRVAGRFTFVEMNVDGEDYKAWRKKFERPTNGNLLPVLYVVRSDGKQIRSSSGEPENITAWLNESLAETGRELNPAQMKVIAKALEEAKGLVEEGRPADAMAKLSKHAASGCFAGAAADATTLFEELSGKARKEMEEAAGKLEKSAADLEAAVTLMKGIRLYGRVVDLKKLGGKLLLKLRKDKDVATLLKQAELLDVARDAEAKDPKKSIPHYRKLADSHGESAAGKEAVEKLKKLESGE